MWLSLLGWCSIPVPGDWEARLGAWIEKCQMVVAAVAMAEVSSEGVGQEESWRNKNIT